MPRGYKFAPAQLAEEAKKLEKSNTSVRGVTPNVTKLLDAGITGDTLSQYAGRITQLTLFLKGVEEKSLTLELFASWLLARRSVAAAAAETADDDPVEGFRSAILHFQTSRGLWLSDSGEAWAGSDQCIQICKGHRYQSKAAPEKRPRGAVEASMFPDFRDWIRLHYPALSDPVTIEFGTGVRSHALVALHGGSYNPTTRVLRHLSKAANARNKLPNYEETIVIDDAAHKTLCSLLLSRATGGLLFPTPRQGGKWNLSIFRRAMKEAAVALEWPEGLKFDGPHCLRHGRLSHLSEEVSGEDIKKVMNLSHQMIKHYGKSNKAKLANKGVK